MNPRQLRYFVAIAKAGSISQAALALHIAQPSLSQHMAAIEEELGVSLLKRHARGVKLTAEGRQLADAATAALTDLEVAEGFDRAQVLALYLLIANLVGYSLGPTTIALLTDRVFGDPLAIDQNNRLSATTASAA